MRAKELRMLTDAELRARLEEARRELFVLRQDWYMNRLQDNNRITAVKRDIARILTILRERELARQMEQGGAQ
ncbi:MAG: 50S ribosomal protein L29 [Anaerolineae bacterium]|nr:50S ribosomal protein L29 [Anaerolineae bacterium]MCX8067602.1 50S ribosomal protein L29 [Anaerolineae bacterium]MDW7991876.1 50S ribosomal protein L29 [Anaerolineae bacterium]